MDRARFKRRRDDQTLGHSHSVALVHWAILSRSCGEHIRHAVIRDMAFDEHDWKTRLDCDSLPDPDGNFSRHGPAGWRASDAAGRVSMDCGGDYFFVADFCRMDFALAARVHVRSSSELTEDGWRGLCRTGQFIDDLG